MRRGSVIAAIRVQPDLEGAHNNLAILLFRQGRQAEAWREVHAAIRAGAAPHPGFFRSLSDKLRDPAQERGRGMGGKR